MQFDEKHGDVEGIDCEVGSRGNQGDVKGDESMARDWEDVISYISDVEAMNNAKFERLQEG